MCRCYKKSFKVRLRTVLRCFSYLQSISCLKSTLKVERIHYLDDHYLRVSAPIIYLSFFDFADVINDAELRKCNVNFSPEFSINVYLN